MGPVRLMAGGHRFCDSFLVDIGINMTCPDCEYHKRRAQIWRHQAYKLGGKPLPWEPWVGLTEEEQQKLHDEWQKRMDGWGSFYQAIEAKLKEKNGG